MIYKTFVPKTFQQKGMDTITQAEEIIQDYANEGYTLTLRQLYYQFVARDLIPNNDKQYKRLGKIVADARLAGLLPWDGIEDRGRNTTKWRIEESISRIVGDLEFDFNADHWAGQEYYVEVWVEKEALASVVERACRPLRVPYLPCKGYLSASEMYEAGKRFARADRQGKMGKIIHLGDHDPSGIDMSRDNHERVQLLSGADVDLHRVALNMPQVEEYSPPPNPTKFTDSRATGYAELYGNTSWELDALEPSVLVSLITNEIEPLIDQHAWAEARDLEREKRTLLRRVDERWDEIEPILARED